MPLVLTSEIFTMFQSVTSDADERKDIREKAVSHGTENVKRQAKKFCLSNLWNDRLEIAWIMEFLLDYSQFHVSNALFQKQMDCLLSVAILTAFVCLSSHQLSHLPRWNAAPVSGQLLFACTHKLGKWVILYFIHPLASSARSFKTKPSCLQTQ